MIEFVIFFVELSVWSMTILQLYCFSTEASLAIILSTCLSLGPLSTSLGVLKTTVLPLMFLTIPVVLFVGFTTGWLTVDEAGLTDDVPVEATAEEPVAEDVDDEASEEEASEDVTSEEEASEDVTSDEETSEEATDDVSLELELEPVSVLAVHAAIDTASSEAASNIAAVLLRLIIYLPPIYDLF